MTMRLRCVSALKFIKMKLLLWIKYYNQQNKLHSLNADLDALKVLEQLFCYALSLSDIIKIGKRFADVKTLRPDIIGCYA